MWPCLAAGFQSQSPLPPAIDDYFLRPVPHSPSCRNRDFDGLLSLSLLWCRILLAGVSSRQPVRRRWLSNVASEEPKNCMKMLLRHIPRCAIPLRTASTGPVTSKPPGWYLLSDSESARLTNPGLWIFRCLKGIGAICGPHRLDQLVDEKISELDREKELKKYKSTTQNLVIVAVLIATVTFAAAFTMPGGYKADDHRNGGTPTLAGKYAFKAFVISDFLAFACSMAATILLMYSGTLTAGLSFQLGFICRSYAVVAVAAHSMVTAFAMSVFVVLAPANNAMAILICIFSFGSIILFTSQNIWQLCRLVSILRSRLGWSRMCKIRVASTPGTEDDAGNIYYVLFVHAIFCFLPYIILFLVPFLVAIPHSRISH